MLPEVMSARLAYGCGAAKPQVCGSGAEASVIVALERCFPSAASTLNLGFHSPLAHADPSVRTVAMKKPLEPIARVIGSPVGSLKRIARASGSVVRPAIK